MRSTFRILFFLKRDKQKASGCVPLFCRITIDGKTARFGLKVDIHPDLWDTKAGQALGRSQQSIEINSLLTKTRAALQRTYSELLLGQVDVTAEKVKNHFLGIATQEFTLLSLFDRHNEDARKLIGIGKAKATWQKYERTRHLVAAFLKAKYNLSDISFKELNPMMLTDFEIYLKTVGRCSDNTTAKYMQFFKRIVLMARNNGWLHTDPFANYRIRITPTDRGYLTEEELSVIMQKSFVSERLERVRDIFIFSCYTGLAYIEVFNLCEENIRTGFDGNFWIMGKRKKTGVNFNVPLLNVPQMIIDKYRGKTPDGKLLPVASNQKMNGYLKEIGDICGIQKPITFHLARHTFATWLLTKGVSIESVSKMLGHTDIKTTQIYARVLNTKVSNEVAAFGNRIQGLEHLMTVNA